MLGANQNAELYGYKVDITNYFNSIDISILIPKMKRFFQDDKKLFVFLKSILEEKNVYINDEIINDEFKGIMAGAPISAPLANLYLKEIDEYFEEENVLYVRYSDDILFFTKKENFEKCQMELEKRIKEYNLKFNPEKVKYIKPNEKWEFLGFSYENGRIDISNVAKQKMKGKIKRLAKKLRRWMIRKNATYDRAIRAMIRKMNRKFYQIDNKTELTWQLWYFPIINTTKRFARDRLIYATMDKIY